MKKFFTQHINFAHAMIVLLVLVVGIGTASGATLNISSGYGLPGEITKAILHQGGSEQVISDLRLGECPPEAPANDPCNPFGAALDTRGGPLSVSLFDATTTGAFLAVLEDAVFFKNLYVSSDTGASISFWNTPHGINNLTSPIQKVSVDGNVLATNLVNSTGNRDVCVTQEGDIVLCPNLTLGSCGLAAGHTYSTPPTSNLCSAGTASAVTTNSTTYDWTCTGSGGSVACQANRIIPVDGVCGPAAGHTYSTPPTTGLCNAGNAGSVQTNPTNYTWTCYGTGGGTNDSCQANRILATNGQCRTYSGMYTSQPATNNSTGCLAGTYTDIVDSSTQFKWSCLGSNGGIDDTPCTADIAPPANPACKPYTGVYTSQPATNTATGCDVGTYSDLSDTATEWLWRCSANGTNLTCAADKQTYNGYYFICGSDPEGTPSFSTGERPGLWTRGPLYDPVNTGDDSPYTMGAMDCNGAVTPPPATTVIDLPTANSSITTNPTNGDTLYYERFCYTSAPSICNCKVNGYTEQIC
ncbi:hypothetical protein KC901_02335 [Patescibacteria group bacterium]|nr:hypothetical protein [Patescibacteria group bacterium]